MDNLSKRIERNEEDIKELNRKYETLQKDFNNSVLIEVKKFHELETNLKSHFDKGNEKTTNLIFDKIIEYEANNKKIVSDLNDKIDKALKEIEKLKNKEREEVYQGWQKIKSIGFETWLRYIFQMSVIAIMTALVYAISKNW